MFGFIFSHYDLSNSTLPTPCSSNCLFYWLTLQLPLFTRSSLGGILISTFFCSKSLTISSLPIHLKNLLNVTVLLLCWQSLNGVELKNASMSCPVYSSEDFFTATAILFRWCKHADLLFEEDLHKDIAQPLRASLYSSNKSP